MSVDNKDLTDKQIRDVCILIDDNLRRSIELDHRLFSEQIPLKTILNDMMKVTKQRLQKVLYY